MSPYKNTDTICALSTPPGRSAIALIRLSGSNSHKYIKQLCPQLPEKLESHRAYYVKMYVPETHELLDEVIVTYFQEGRSFTGEDVVEVSCHGNQIIIYDVLNNFCRLGCRPAHRGEFTYRAYASNKIDLIQAESVASLIEGQTHYMTQISFKQLGGHTSEVLKKNEETIQKVLSHIEAYIDFSEEDIDPHSLEELKAKLVEALKSLSSLSTTYHKSSLFKEGLSVVLVGLPNAGKSSLFNALLGEDQAIVTAQAGTTRDLIKGRVEIAGVPIEIIDTAGWQETQDVIEAIGLQKAKEVTKKSYFVFYICDLSEAYSEGTFFSQKYQTKLLENIKFLDPKNIVFLGNKSDLKPGIDLTMFKKSLNQNVEPLGIVAQDAILVSALAQEGVQSVFEYLEQFISSYEVSESTVLIQARHYDLVHKMTNSLSKAVEFFDKEGHLDIIATELHSTLGYLCELFGEDIDDRVLDKVFQEFCIGK